MTAKIITFVLGITSAFNIRVGIRTIINGLKTERVLKENEDLKQLIHYYENML